MPKHPGLIPTSLLAPHITRWVEEFEEAHGDDLSGLWVLAFRTWGTTGNVEKMRKISNGTISHIEFDLADKAICAMGDASLWYELGKPFKRTPDNESGFVFRDVYWKVKLSGTPRTPKPKARCAYLGCSNAVIPAPGAVPGRKKYCSKTCQHAAWAHRSGLRQNGIKSLKYDKCRNGHDKSEENTTHLKNGKTRCRLCALDATKRSKAKDPERYNREAREKYHREKAEQA